MSVIYFWRTRDRQFNQKRGVELDQFVKRPCWFGTFQKRLNGDINTTPSCESTMMKIVDPVHCRYKSMRKSFV